MRGGAGWPLAVAAVLAATVIANAFLFIAAQDRNAAVVEPDYYRKAVEWDSTQAQERHNGELGWRLDAELGPGAGGRVPLRVRLIDPDGRPLDGATGWVTAIHNAEAGNPVTAALARAPGGGYRATLRLHRGGLWELRFVIQRDAERFTATLRREIEPPPS
ncbi:MAG TPA: FixH family protein [Candidatus Eisenbacteria bacterium]|jgi:nitrogen fixation protein FixH